MTKRCPFCAEEIQDAAIKCKHCGEMLNLNSQKDESKIAEVDTYFDKVKTKKHSENSWGGKALAEARDQAEATDQAEARDQVKSPTKTKKHSENSWGGKALAEARVQSVFEEKVSKKSVKRSNNKKYEFDIFSWEKIIIVFLLVIVGAFIISNINNKPQINKTIIIERPISPPSAPPTKPGSGFNWSGLTNLGTCILSGQCGGPKPNPKPKCEIDWGDHNFGRGPGIDCD